MKNKTSGCVTKNAKYDKLGNTKKFATNDTSYSSIWKYNTTKDIKSEHFQQSVKIIDNFINFADDKIFSEFNPSTAKNIISFWSKKDDSILDPFAGRTRALISYVMGRKYFGFEININTWKYNQKLIDFYSINKNNTKIVPIDCDNINIAKQWLKYKKLKHFDMLFTCPPYWNIETYGNKKNQLSNINNYTIFLKELIIRLNKNINLIKKDGYICIVVGDFRKNKKYYTFHNDIINEFKNNKDIKLHDIVILQNIPYSVGAFYFGSSKRNKKVAKIHEYLLVFKKK